MVQGVQVSIGSKACLPHNVTLILNKSDRGRERERESKREGWTYDARPYLAIYSFENVAIEG